MEVRMFPIKIQTDSLLLFRGKKNQDLATLRLHGHHWELLMGRCPFRCRFSATVCPPAWPLGIEAGGLWSDTIDASRSS